MFNDFIFFITEAINGMRRSGMMIAISIATITVSLIVFGIFLLVSVNINHLANFMASKLEIRVYLKDSVSAPEISALQARIRASSQVKEVTFVSKAEGWTQFKKSYPSMALSDMFTSNPLPNSFRVFVLDESQFESYARYLQTLTEYVEDVTYGDVMADRIRMVYRFSRYSGYILVGLLTVATLMIVMNTIRLTVIARKTEIEIMQLVGATNSFIRAPFLIEGFLIGVIGSASSIGILRPMYSYLAIQFQEKVPFFPLVYDPTTLMLVYISIGMAGVLLGVLGAFIAVSRTLKITY
jgi:cell division transport system permease protein